MSLSFSRTDITQTSQAERGTMTVFPLTKGKRQQKLALGDGDGVIQTIGVKNDERVSVFKTNPGPTPLSSLVLEQARTQTDKRFASCGNVVKGVNKKGKEFFKFTTNLTEPIAKLHVDNVTIWAAGEYVTNQYVNCEDGFEAAADFDSQSTADGKGACLFKCQLSQPVPGPAPAPHSISHGIIIAAAACAVVVLMVGVITYRHRVEKKAAQLPLAYHAAEVPHQRL